MEQVNFNDTWSELTAEEKKRRLYENQKKLLDTFLEKHAITRAQYEKSLGDLTRKMGYGEPDGPDGEN